MYFTFMFLYYLNCILNFTPADCCNLYYYAYVPVCVYQVFKTLLFVVLTNHKFSLIRG